MQHPLLDLYWPFVVQHAFLLNNLVLVMDVYKACLHDFDAYVQYKSIYTPIKYKLLYGIDRKMDSPHTKIDLVKISWQARTTKPRYRLQKGKYTV